MFLIVLISTSLFQQTKDKIHHLVILETTDVHGALFPYDFINDETKDWGYLAASFVIDSIRNIYGQENVIYVDCGDLLQGDPLAEYYNYTDTLTLHPLIQVLNDLQVDAFIVGNHDIEQGFKVWRRARKQSHFPWLAANIVSQRNQDSLFFKPYHIINKNGLKIGILGLTTPAVPNWLPEKLWKGMKFEDMEKTAQKYIWLRDSVDFLIGAFHSGVSPQKGKKGYPPQLPEENASLEVMNHVKIFDAILAGHEHKLIPKEPQLLRANETPLVMARKKAQYVGVINISYKRENGTIRIVSKEVKNIKVNKNKLNQRLVNKYSEIQKTVQNYVREPIGELLIELDGKRSRLEDTPVIELIHNIQKSITGAQISIASSFNTKLHILPGKITRKTVFAIYPYENSLYKVKIKGKYLVDLLQRSAGYYHLDSEGKLKITSGFPGYNFDMIDGITYDLIYQKNQEPTVKIYHLENGEPFHPEQEYIVAVNSYRAQQLKQLYNAQIIWRSEKTLRDYIEQYAKLNSPLTIKADHNWKIVIK